MAALYSYPPGSGGDHIIKMLLDDHSMQGRAVVNLLSLKVPEHKVMQNKDHAPLLHLDYTRMKWQSPTIGCHETEFYQDWDCTKIRAVWYDPSLDSRLVFRDLMTNDFESSLPPFYPANHPLHLLMQNQKLTQRRRLLLFVKYFQKHQPRFSHAPLGWITFPLDRIFTEVFIDDLAVLARMLGLRPDRDRYLYQHRKWLQYNPERDFTLRNVIRHLEDQKISWFS